MKPIVIKLVCIGGLSLISTLHAGVQEDIAKLPDVLFMRYCNEPIAEVQEEIPKEHKQGVAATRAIQFIKLTKQGGNFRIERRIDEKEGEADFIVSFDGKRFYYFMSSQGLLQVGSNGDLFEKNLISTLAMNPLTFVSTPGFSQGSSRIAAELGKKENLTSLAFAADKGPRWYDLSWKFDHNMVPNALFPTEVTIKRFNSKENHEKGLIDSVSSRRIRVLQVSLVEEKLPPEFFALPLSKAKSLIDYDVSDREVPVKQPIDGRQ